MELTSQPPVTAADVCRGSCRLFALQGWTALAEVTLPDGHRADLVALGPAGAIAIVEVKVSAADLAGDCKWTAYPAFCDRFFWAVPPHLAPLLSAPRYAPERAGLIVGDRHDALFARDAAAVPLPPARRSALIRLLARQAMARLHRAADPDFDGWGRVGGDW